MRMKNREVGWHTLQFMSGLAEHLRPKEPMTISEWADRYMVLPEGSSEAGKFSTAAIPYQKAIMDAITDPEVIDVAVMSSAQVGKTTIIMCGIAYYIDYEPATQMLVMPTITDGEKFSKTRFSRMIADVPQLASKVADAKTRSSSNTIMLKIYPGGSISIGGANSPSSLASDPRRIIWMDEVDRFPESAGSEGNPIKLAEKRATSYWNKKHIKTSTPTIAGRSKIEDAYNEGSMEVWNVQCPECGAWQPYDFRRVDFKSVSMACMGCGVLISEREWKDSNHKWIALHPERKKKRSFRLNELASPFVDWEDIIADFRKASDRLKRFHDPEDMKVFINTVLGETWDETKYVDNAVDEDTLEARAEVYAAEIPDGVLLLTAAVDVQDNRFEVEIRGWARGYETWGIYKTEIYGDLITDEPWDALEAYLSQPLHFENGTELNVAGFTVDTGGHFTNRTYKWIKKMKAKGKNCYGIKGYAGKPDIPLLHHRTVVNIKEVKNGKEFVVDHTLIQIVGVDSGKEDITNRLKIKKIGVGYCHFPAGDGRGYDEAYFKGLLSEKQITKKVKGVIKKVWVKKSGVRNEPLDLFNYNYAALELLRPDWDKLEEKLKQGKNYMQRPQKIRERTRRKSIKGIEA
ncbi:MAG: phage terminase large subunit family protein [Candidatus Gastranaerophilales bacterium]|nr:phage terminase large subunit family protein [Candidatus Gastranaerophilales bacterium]